MTSQMIIAFEEVSKQSTITPCRFTGGFIVTVVMAANSTQKAIPKKNSFVLNAIY